VTFFKQYLSPEILNAIDLNHLEPCQQSYIDSELKLMQSDVLYKTSIHEQLGYLYLLLEHQSTPDKLMPFRMLKYHMGIWDDHLKQTKEKGNKENRDHGLPLIVGLVFYNGREPYTYSCDIKDLINAPMLLIEKVWNKPFQLIDVRNVADEEMREHLWSGILAFFMKHIYERDFLPFLKKVISELSRLEQHDGTDYAISLLNYVLNAGETSDVEQFVEIVKGSLSEKAGGTVMTIAEQFIERGKKYGIEQGMQQGMKQGIQQGVQKGLRQGESIVLMRLLKHKFSAIPEKYALQIEQASEETLLEWSERVIDAETLKDIFDE